MKRKIIIFFYICLLLFLLFHPKEALTGVKNGLGLWLNIMIPTLLPFLILTGALLKTGNIRKFLKPSAFFWKTFFGLSPAGAYVLILGLLCGYPMGAKLAHDLYIGSSRFPAEKGNIFLRLAAMQVPHLSFPIFPAYS